MKLLSIGLFAISALAGCGSTGGVMKLGPDTYTVTASKHNFAGGAPSAQSNALEMANAYCEGIGREVMVKNTTTGFDRPMYTYSVTFQCLNKGDASLVRPNYRPAPNVVIENK
jgi:hypothetical protein